jgi:hypothetical protein
MPNTSIGWLKVSETAWPDFTLMASYLLWWLWIAERY